MMKNHYLKRATDWITANVILDRDCDIEYLDLYKKLELLLKEQDRDTRHACAEAILYSDWNHMDVDGVTEVISVDIAHNICINTKVKG